MWEHLADINSSLVEVALLEVGPISMTSRIRVNIGAYNRTF